MRSALPRLFVAITLTATSVHAQDCDVSSSEPFNYFTFAEPFPAPDSTEVPCDAALILRGNGFGIGGSPVVFSWFTVDTVTVTDQAGNVVPGRIAAEGFSRTSPAVSWMPDQPFGADAEYHVAAELAPQSTARPEEAEGSETLEFRFTTGSTSGGELAIESPLEVVITSAPFPINDCETVDCVTTCTEIGEYRGLVARVTLPAVHGGTDVEGYEGLMILSDTAPIDFDGPGSMVGSGDEVYVPKSVHLTAGEVQQIEVQLPPTGEPYVPCFALNVWDPGRRYATATPLCLDAVDPPAPDAVLDGPGGAGGAASSTTEGSAGATDTSTWGAAGEDGRGGSGGEPTSRSQSPASAGSEAAGAKSPMAGAASDDEEPVNGDAGRHDAPANGDDRR